jgi:PPOX class probable F420-dependent enzyme
VRLDPRALPDAARRFLAERHLATVTTARPDGRLHAVPVGFTWDDATGTARIITSRTSRKVANVAAGGRDGVPVVVCQVDGPRWLSLEGQAHIADDREVVADAEARYQVRYRPPRPNPERVVIVVTVAQILGSATVGA